MPVCAHCETRRQNEIELVRRRLLHYTTRQVEDDWTPYLSQIQQAIRQLGGLELPEYYYERKVGEAQGRYIIDGEGRCDPHSAEGSPKSKPTKKRRGRRTDLGEGELRV